MRRGAALLLVAAGIAMDAAPAGAQGLAGARALGRTGVAESALFGTTATPLLPAASNVRWARVGAQDRLLPSPPAPTPGAAGLLSLALPGAGQHVLGQTRKWAYLVVEAAAWAFWVDRRASGGRYRDEYRDLAWNAARHGAAARVDGDFRYYETLTHWTRSGAFDRDGAAPGVQPEDDPSTFNGSIWGLAKQIFLPAGAPVDEDGPAYASALAYYQERAYDAQFLWDWSEAEDARGRYADLIERSDSRFRQATTALGIVIANHLLSAADGYLSARSGSAPAVRLRVAPAGAPVGPAWWAVASFTVSP